MRLITRNGAIRIACLLAFMVILSLWSGACMISMPGKSHSGPLAPLTSRETGYAESLRRDVAELAGRIGIRNSYAHESLCAAADYMESRMGESGRAVRRNTYDIDGKAYHNLEVEIPGGRAPAEIVVIGAHYDSVIGCPGANDNGSGAAALVALLLAVGRDAPERTLRFVAFTNEEPPHFQTELMGSRVYAKRCRERKENIVAMMSIETIGCYLDEAGTQDYPFPLSLFYPSRGNFIAFVGNVASRRLVRQAIGCFREKAAFPSEGAALPGGMPGVGWSDHWAFWQEGYPGIMVTDTAPFRYPHYHHPKDTPDRLDYDRCARVVAGLEEVIRELAGCR